MCNMIFFMGNDDFLEVNGWMKNEIGVAITDFYRKCGLVYDELVNYSKLDKSGDDSDGVSYTDDEIDRFMEMSVFVDQHLHICSGAALQ